MLHRRRSGAPARYTRCLEPIPGSSATSRLLQRFLRAPDHPAKLRFVRWLGRRFPRGVRTRLPEGIVLHLSPADWIEYLLLTGQPYEPATRAVLRHNLRPGDGAIFAGVNFGLHVVDAALAVGRGGRIVGVEPQPAARARATRNLASNGAAAQTTLIAAALAAQPGRTTMAWAPGDNAGAASLLTEGAGFDVDLVPLSQVEYALDGKPLRALLLDVQGYELEALRGLGRLPDVIVCEAADEWISRTGSSVEALARELECRGYQLFDVLGRPVAHDRLADLPEHNICARLPDRGITFPPPRVPARSGRLPA